MGEFSSKLMAELAKETGKNLHHTTNGHQASQKKPTALGSFALNTNFSETAKELNAQFKDALFTLVMLRARNFMHLNNMDSKQPAFRRAKVVIEIDFSSEDIVHSNDLTAERKPHEYKNETGARGGIPRIEVNENLDKLSGFEIDEFVKEFNEIYLLGCKVI